MTVPLFLPSLATAAGLAAALSLGEISAALLSDLARRRMIYTGKDGKPRLDPNLEPVLWILNSPD